MLTEAEELVTSLMDIMPTREDDTPISTSGFERLKEKVSSGQKTYTEWVKDPENVRITDNMSFCLRLLEHVGCSPEVCGSPIAAEPKHLYFHLNTLCTATTDHNAWVEKKGACPWCTGGIQSNVRRAEFYRARTEYLAQLRAKEAQAVA